MLSIGEFSKLSRVSARMLRHYDAIGLLRPEYVGDNGYRYYRQEQLSDILRMERLKGYGFPLAQVGELLALDESELLRRLQRRRWEVYWEIQAQQEVLHRMEADILRMEGAIMSEYHVILMEDPEQKVFSLRRRIGVSEFHMLFQDLRKEADRRGIRQAGPIQVRYHDPEFNQESSDVEAQMVVAQDGPDVGTKPAYTCAAVIHKGSYEKLNEAYDALCGWLAAHPEYHVCAAPLERYLNDPHQVDAPEELETAVLFPVKKTNNNRYPPAKNRWVSVFLICLTAGRRRR